MIRDRPVRALASVLLVVCVVGKSGAQSTAPTEPAEWTEKDPLPLLVATQIQPVAEREIFKIDDLYIEYLLEEKHKASGRLFASVVEAVASARKWTVAHFGEAPADTPLKLKGVDLVPGEAATPFNARAADHDVGFRQFYRGIPTSCRVVFDATGQTPTRVIIELRRFKPVADSAKPVVSKEAAIKAWRDIYATK